MGLRRAPGLTAADRMADAPSPKETAGREALVEIASGMTLGLGTGSTVRFFLEALGEALRQGALEGIVGVPTSWDTEARCRVLGIPTTELTDGTTLDVAIDGADEVSPELDLVKGLGGALLREKIVVQAARRFVVIADESKEVAKLGVKASVPIEVAPFGWRSHLEFFRSLGAEPLPRETADGELMKTDNGNHVVDLRFAAGIDDPARLESRLRSRAGVVETGLFLGMADDALIGMSSGEVLRRSRDRRGG